MKKEKTIETIRKYLEKQEWAYKIDDRGNIRSGFSVESRLGHVDMVLYSVEGGFLVLAVSPIKADPKKLDEVIRYLTVVNYSLKFGNFELDVKDGEIRYKFDACCEGIDEIPEALIRRAIAVPVNMYGKYGDGLCRIIFGLSDAKKELQTLKDAERDED